MYTISKVVNFPFDTPAEKSALTGMPFPLLVPQFLSPRLPILINSSNLGKAFSGYKIYTYHISYAGVGRSSVRPFVSNNLES